MIQNSSGKRPSDLTAFDALPRPLKVVLWCAPRSYSPMSVRAAWKASGMTSAKYAARMIAKLRCRFPGWRPDIRDSY